MRKNIHSESEMVKAVKGTRERRLRQGGGRGVWYIEGHPVSMEVEVQRDGRQPGETAEGA